MNRTLPTIGLFITNTIDRRLLTDFLRESGYEAQAALPGAPDLREWEQVSLILTDETAARRHGRQMMTLKQRSGAALLPLLILLPQKADGVVWLRAGFDDVLRQPLTKAELTARLAVFLRLREQAEEQYRLIFENVLIGIYRLTPDGRVLLANPAFARMMGYESPDELMTLQPGQTPLRAQPAAAELAQRLAGEGQKSGLETIWTKRDGTRLFACESIRCVRDETGGTLYYEGTIEDITERKQAEEELRQTLQREREMKEAPTAANRTRDEFLAMISHELRTPLNAILGWAQLLRSGAFDIAEAAHAVEVIESNARTQARLIEDLLDISRITTGKLRLNIVPVELTSVIRAALDIVRPAAEARGIRLITHLAADAGLITGDPDRLQQIVWNLLANAVKFTPRDGRIEVRLERAGSHIEIAVSDTGQGIRPEFLPYVFERFRQADSAITRAHGGLGLGLSIARHLVELHGGAIRAESGGEGQGARFIVRLPLLAVHKAPEPPGRSAGPTEQAVIPDGLPRLDGLRVLVVDDEATSCEIITALLTRSGAEVRSSSSAAEARQTLAAWRPDVLISDTGCLVKTGMILFVRSGPPGRRAAAGFPPSPSRPTPGSKIG